MAEPPCDTGFLDVGPAHLFCPAIAWAADAGLVSGWPDGTYRPANDVTRQAMAAFLAVPD